MEKAEKNMAIASKSGTAQVRGRCGSCIVCTVLITYTCSDRLEESINGVWCALYV